MGISFLDVLLTVFSLVVLIIPGYVLAKLKVIDQGAGSVLSTVVLYVCQPAIAFIGFQKAHFNSNIAVNMLVVALLAISLHMVMFLIVWLITCKSQKTPKLKIIRYASMFGNCGYMGLPFLQSLFAGQDAIFGEILIYGAIVIAVFNVFSWTLGVYIVSGDKKEVSLKKILLNPTIIAIVLGFILFVGVQKPLTDMTTQGGVVDGLLEGVMKAITFLSDTVTPISMMVIGMRLASIKPSALITEKSTYFVSGLKLIAMSLLTILSVAFLPIAYLVKSAMFFLLSMPCAASSVLLAIKYGADDKAGSIYVIFSTIASILTIPLMFLLFEFIIGLV